MGEHYLDKRFDLIEKMDNDRSYEPTDEETHEAYGYLDCCLECGKGLKFFDAYTHGFEGNVHKFGCSIPSKILGYIYTLIGLILGIVFLPILLLWIGGEWIYKKLSQSRCSE